MNHLSLCTGYGGIDLALRDMFAAETVAVADVDAGACKILAHRFPNVPNLGDITTADWHQWAGRVDIISGGTPCQDLSHAGRRAGMTDGTRSNLWVAMREAIATIRPQLVVWENVRGAYSATADSAVEPCQGCVGDGSGVHLRALGRVLGDLSSLGYDANWYGLRASDVGAAHHRYRVFVFAWPTDTDRLGWERRGRARLGWDRPADSDRPNVTLPTHAVNDMGEGKTVEDWDAWREKMRTKHGNGNGHGASLAIEAQRLAPTLQTPRATDGSKGGPNQRGSSGDLMLPSAVCTLPTPSVADIEGGRKSRSGDRSDELLLNGIAAEQRWGKYAEAIHRQEEAFGHPAPAPTEPTGRNGNPRLSPKFTEWLMGLPAGWITDVPGITRNEAVKACGNGVVPQQCAEAARRFIRDTALEAAA